MAGGQEPNIRPKRCNLASQGYLLHGYELRRLYALQVRHPSLMANGTKRPL